MSGSGEQPLVIAVLGATGNQGGGVVHALLERNFTVLALTRDVESRSAQSLKAESNKNERLRLASADVYKVETLYQAFNGVCGVFAVTSHRTQGKPIETETDLEHELIAGRNIVQAAEACNIRHFVFSSLPNISKASNGQFTKVFHFDHKSQIEQWAKEKLHATTIVHPGLFYTNMLWPQYCKRKDDGMIQFCASVLGSKSADWVDPCYDIGIYVAEIFARGPETTASKTYPVVGPKLTFAEMATIFQTITSQRAQYEPISLDEWGATVAASAGPGFERDIRQMIEWIAVAPDEKICYGTMDSKDDHSQRDLGVRASTFQDWLKRSGWTGPLE